MLTFGGVVCLLIFVFLILVWVAAAISGKEYQEYIDAVEGKDYPLKDLYTVGFGLLKWVKYKYMSNADRKRINECAIIYGEKYGEFYYRINLAARCTFAFTLAMISFLLVPLFGADGWIGFVIGVGGAGLAWWYFDDKITSIIKERELMFGKDFPDVLSKIALLINAGMIMREAWATVAETGDGLIYNEMKETINAMENGSPEIDAYIDFGARCGTSSIRKFTSLLTQNLTKGNAELTIFLQDSSKQSWIEKKQLAKIEGEKANNKMIIPIGLMLVGILVMILVPIMTNMF